MFLNTIQCRNCVRIVYVWCTISLVFVPVKFVVDSSLDLLLIIASIKMCLHMDWNAIYLVLTMQHLKIDQHRCFFCLDYCCTYCHQPNDRAMRVRRAYNLKSRMFATRKRQIDEEDKDVLILLFWHRHHNFRSVSFHRRAQVELNSVTPPTEKRPKTVTFEL